MGEDLEKLIGTTNCPMVDEATDVKPCSCKYEGFCKYKSNYPRVKAGVTYLPCKLEEKNDNRRTI